MLVINLMALMVIIYKENKRKKYLKFNSLNATETDDEFVIETPVVNEHGAFDRWMIPRKYVIDVMPEKLFNKEKSNFNFTRRVINPLAGY